MLRISLLALVLLAACEDKVADSVQKLLVGKYAAGQAEVIVLF